jgi:tetratricopeptide (TPR) repeat protein
MKGKRVIKPPYTLDMLEDESTRRQVSEQLSHKIWLMKLERKNVDYGFLIHDNFDVLIYISAFDFPDLACLRQGDQLEVKVVTGKDHKKNIYNYKGVPIFFRDKHKNDPEYKALKQAVLVQAKRQFPFEINSQEICVYIDERWPSTENDAEEYKGIAIISGIVWDAPEPDKSCLPYIPDHLRNVPEMITAFTNFFTCVKAFPFLFSFQTQKHDPSPDYHNFVRAALKILFGWLLNNKTKANPIVRIILEANKQAGDGSGRTHFYRGVFTEASESLSKQIKQWHLNEVKWLGKKAKDTGYIPYADLLAALIKSSSFERNELAALVNPKHIQGYVPVSGNLLPMLAELDLLNERTRDFNSIFKLLGELRGTFLGREALTKLRKKITSSDILRDRMINALEELYSAKDRDLVTLSRLVSDIGDAAGAPNKLKLRSKFIWLLIKLQNANHHGNPKLAKQILTNFESLRGEVAQSDPGLAADADLNLVVHFNDQFCFEEAKRLNLRLVEMGERLPRQVYGRVLSSFGQCCSMSGEYTQADTYFTSAIKAFRAEAEFGLDMSGDIEQTLVYGAINAIDGNMDNAATIISAVIGDPIEEEARELSINTTPRTVYRHHLLVRALWFGVLPHECKETYLAASDDWQQGDNRHPWELIALYRALMLNDLQASKKWFSHALEIASDPDHGATLSLIGAVIATVAYCRHRDIEFRHKATHLMDKVPQALPAVEPLVRALRNHLKSTGDSKINDVLRLLPFNYH